MASLFVIRGRDQGKHFPIAATVIRLGRDATNDIQLLDNEASRSHAEVRHNAATGQCELVDLGSSNGSRVNGQTIQRCLLSSGDRLEIGSTLMIFTGGGNVAAMDAAHGVDIVRHAAAGEASQIVSSLARRNLISDSQAGSLSSQKSESEVLPSDQESPPGQGPSIGLDAPGLDTDQSLEVMYLTALAVGRTDDLNEVLERILRLVFDWVEADRGCVMLRDVETKRLTPAARCDRSSGDGSTTDGKASQQRITISHTILDYVLQQKEGVRTSNAVGDERFDNAASIVQGGVREALCVPLQGRYEIVGALYVDTYTSPGQWIQTKGENRFNDEHLRLITAIGHQAALAIEDTFYYSALLQGERLAAMGQTIATLSHHIKNILQGVRGGSYLIESGLEKGDTDAIRKGWSIVDRNQERISNLVLDMLTFSKEREPQRIEADLNATIQDVIELMRGRAGDLEIEIGTHFDENLPMSSFDPDAIHRALLNLITNAIDAAEQRIHVSSAFDAASGWTIDVADDGEGVPEEERAEIFSLFESKKGARGTGLGLPVTAKIMNEHGGRVEVDDAPGGGARFRMIFPIMGTDIHEATARETQI